MVVGEISMCRSVKANSHGSQASGCESGEAFGATGHILKPACVISAWGRVRAWAIAARWENLHYIASVEYANLRAI